jgi:hypothetical protein
MKITSIIQKHWKQKFGTENIMVMVGIYNMTGKNSNMYSQLTSKFYISCTST